MRLSLKDIDLKLADRINKRVKEFENRDPTSAFRGPIKPPTAGSFEDTLQCREKAYYGLTTLSAAGVSILLFVTAWLIARARGGFGDPPTDIFPVVGLIAALFAGAISLNVAMLSRMRRNFSTLLLRTGLKEVSESRVEQLYTDTVFALAAIDATTIGGESAGQDILKQLNSLMEAGHLVARGQDDMHQVRGPRPLTELQTEVETLERRANQAVSVDAAATLQQSAQIARERLQSIQALGEVSERLDAQEEVICQTLASVQTALNRMRIAPQTGAVIGQFPDMAQTIRGINVQTRSVEQAVLEVILLQKT